MKPQLPFRLGSTSRVYPADIVPNVRRLAALVDDVELVLFEVNEQSQLPSPTVVAELEALARMHNLTYTVHLPLDLRLAARDDGRRHSSMDKARRAVQATLRLIPWAYVIHLDGPVFRAGGAPAGLARWHDRAVRSLEMIGREAGDPRLLAVENLEHYDPRIILPLLDELPVGLCVDVGHFLNRGEEALPYLQAHLERTRVIHVHGFSDGHDHRGLDLIPDGLLTRMLDLLLADHYHGVLTVEVFTERHFSPGRDLILTLMKERV
ncbi:MAG: cobamide remodeling phosphodiesterase CbiR [Anaerolineales bacterium]